MRDGNEHEQLQLILRKRKYNEYFFYHTIK
jgi:hypothetical protein